MKNSIEKEIEFFRPENSAKERFSPDFFATRKARKSRFSTNKLKRIQAYLLGQKFLRYQLDCQKGSGLQKCFQEQFS